MRQPVPGEGHLVVVVRESPAKETEDVLVDEVEVPEAVDVSGRGMIADGMSLVGIGEAGRGCAMERRWRERAARR